MELEFISDNSQIGYRLQYMELVNWGTFDSKIWRITPGGNNSLLTGPIGSGKSTLVDALTSLIVPHHKIVFNKAAAGEIRERNLLSYIKGYFKYEKDEHSLREKAVTLRYKNPGEMTYTVVLANFFNKGYEQNITLAQVFWLKEDKPQKILLISRLPLNIKTHFGNISGIPELKKRLKEIPNVEIFDENFTQYSQQFRKYFGMNSDKAIDLFYQTVSMKSVSSLTSFVREQMLEKTDVKQQIEDLKKRFFDLAKAHEEVVKARVQKEILFPLSEFSDEYKSISEKIEEIDNILQVMPSYFAEKKQNILAAEIQKCEAKLNRLNNKLDITDKSLKEKREAENQIRQDIFNNGGRRLEEIERLINESENRKKVKKERSDNYNALTSFCDLHTINSEKSFYNNIEKGKTLQLNNSKKQGMQEQQQVDKSVALREIINKISSEQNELDSLLKRKTQIPEEMISIRNQISNDLEINEEDIPFAGELLKVKDEEHEWEGGIERLLHGFGISMLVPDKYYKQISRYVNSRSLLLTQPGGKKKGQRLEYYKIIPGLKLRQNQDTDPDSVVNKLEIKPDSPYRDWLEQEIVKRFNLHCVSIDEFLHQKDVITKEGQIKTGESRHVKDDRREIWDRRYFVLGWSNIDKIKAIEKSIKDLTENKKKIEEELNLIKSELEQIKTLDRKLNDLLGYNNWFDLNWQDEAKEIERLKSEQKEFEESNDKLKTLKNQLDIIIDKFADLDEEKNSILKDTGKIISSVEYYREGIKDCDNIKDIVSPIEKGMYYPVVEKQMGEIELSIRNIDTVREELRKRLSDRNGEKDKFNELQRKTGNKITAQMREYKDKFASEAAELSIEIEALPEFIKIFQNIVLHDLPRHETRFKQMLNENTIHDISTFDNKLDIHQKNIQDKIDKINEHLREIEYNKGTYIKIETDRSTDQDIKKFREELKACYSNILGNQDAYTEERFDLVKKILDRFSSQANNDFEWTNKVTDVRNWFVFNASEKYRLDDTRKNFYPGTSGKSGGQKEKLAYTILASALAYQFGLEYGEPKSKSFRFVVIDEAFGRGDDESTKFGLELFKKLNLQLLIVTPLQKIHIIENYINSVHFVSNPDENNSEIQNLTIEEYKTEKLKKTLIAAE